VANFPGIFHDLGPRPMSPAPLPHTGGKVSVVGARRVQPVSVSDAADVKGAAFTTAGGVTPPAPSGVTLVAKKSDLTPGVPWFDHVHVLPRDPGVQFGNIITTVQATFELFSAYRDTVTLTTFVNNAGAGVEVPDLPSLPYVMAGFTSILDPSSTRLNPVALTVQATPDGPAQFDDTLDFTFAPGGLLMLRVSGNRIALIPFDYEQGFDEVLDFGGEALTRLDGTEQRIDERAYPVQSFNVLYRLDGREKRRLRALLFGWQSRQFVFPVLTERMFLTADVSSGLTVNVDSTADVDLRVGGVAVIMRDDGEFDTFDVLTVASLTATSITFASEVQSSFLEGDRVMPGRLVQGPPRQQSRRPPVNLEDFRLQFVVVDNSTGALTGDVSAFSSLGGEVFLDDCNLIEGSALGIDRQIRVATLDNEVGRRLQEPIWDALKRSFPKVFLAQSRAQLYAIRRLLIALRGPQVSFHVPTFDEDLVATQDIGSASDTLTVENIGYARFVAANEEMATIRATFDDGTEVIRTIQSATELSADEEELTLDTTWGVTKTVSEFVRIEFIDRVRIATPRVRIRHERIGSARVSMPLQQVFN